MEKQWNIEWGKWNGMETVVWNGDSGMKCGMEWNGDSGMERRQWNGMKTVEWNGDSGME